MHTKVKIQNLSGKKSRFAELWDSFWKPPEIKCPKCGSSSTEYYDPFFFSPLRTLKGKRRIKCICCHFVWRQSRTSRAIWDIINPFSS
jgi:hypothetical protein